ncbi:hypothetical protein P691DRAFT_549155 [Macrolepiota fuliginosa MF-IS2]|uniref:Uncharacterized protein n=1 Tax=Macrolepiota fuliginosa MF-IS2 TaxID=1400762 RepID=A0A9P6BXN1_9AGAR|nr:hypothetical protein P691DRAFT_549155 [Macrolepiota fuliginosa MF-IS2]
MAISPCRAFFVPSLHSYQMDHVYSISFHQVPCSPTIQIYFLLFNFPYSLYVLTSRIFPFPLCFTWTLLVYIQIVRSDPSYLSVHLFVVPVNSLDSHSIKIGTYLVLSLQLIQPPLSLICLAIVGLRFLNLHPRDCSSASKIYAEYLFYQN